MADDNLKVKMVMDALTNGEIIERYIDDKPFPSCLVCGNVGDKNIHVVCALPEHVGVLIIITVYEPDPKKWIDNRIRR